MPQTGNRAGEQRLHLFPARDLTRKRSRHTLVRRAPHQTQGLARTVVRKHLQKGRLFQRDCKRHLERSVEDGLAGSVVEVGQDDGVLLGQRASPKRNEV